MIFKVTKDIITNGVDYEDIPIIERAVYDKLRNFEKQLIDDKADIRKNFFRKHYIYGRDSKFL